MNYCCDRHDPTYQITYKLTHPNAIPSEWLVCENCFGKQEFFGVADEIESIVSLRGLKIPLEIDQLVIMTRTVSKKLKKILLVN
ncbi:hypothetical protein [Nitrosopumilus sp.]|uniref:hypothetical protein n=1 Tax=Nitrosopumilus sp. TaxID=2024843 RepID=UPI0034A03498